MGYSHGIRWSDEKIIAKTHEVMSGLGITRMPSRAECVQYIGDESLANAITRRSGGWYKLAADLGLQLKRSDTQTGKMYEAAAADILTGKGFDIERMPQNHPYDLLVDGCVKIDVKASRLYNGKAGNFYSFHIEKPCATCDIYIFIAISNEIPMKVYVIPSRDIIKNKQVSIGEYTSKYDRYIDAWGYISDLADFWRKYTKG